MIEAYKFLHDIYSYTLLTVEFWKWQIAVLQEATIWNYLDWLAAAESDTTTLAKGLSTVEYWNGLPSDVVNASSVNSFKGRLDKHWKEFMTVLSGTTTKNSHFLSLTYWSAKGHQAIKPQKMVNGKW